MIKNKGYGTLIGIIIWISLFILSGTVAPELYEEITGEHISADQIDTNAPDQDDANSADDKETGTSDLFNSKSSQDYYFNQLPDHSQIIYKELYDGIRERKDTIELSTADLNTISKISDAVLFDHPELFWCGSGDFTMMSMDSSKSIVQMNYKYSQDEIIELSKSIDKETRACLNGISMHSSDYDKIQYVYEYLVNLIEYDQQAVNEGSEGNDQNIETALINHKTVCAGYAKTTSYLLNKLGILCIYVIGTANGGEHAWNIVNCEGKYYYLDTTWGDPTFDESQDAEFRSSNISYDYLMVDENTISINHKLDRSLFSYPKCDTMDNNYYVQKGQYYYKFDRDKIWTALCNDIDHQSESSVFVFSSVEEYNRSKGEIMGDLYERGILRMMDHYPNQAGKSTYHLEDDDFHKIVLYWNW